jgi:phage/plasmid primase-like uncharacterized protein
MSQLERIVAACGGRLFDKGRRAHIPGPGHRSRDRSVSLLQTEDGRILIHCFSPRDHWRDVRRALAAQGLVDEAPDRRRASSGRAPPSVAAQPAVEDRVVRAARLWAESRPIAGSTAASYLRGRALSMRDGDGDGLRFHPRMTSLDDRKRRPALIAAVRSAFGALQGVQVTLLSSHGAAKAAVATPRRVIGKLIGGAVRLSEPGAALIVAEGVETALSASRALRAPTWAALSAGNLARFTPPACVRRLIVAADADKAGLMAAAALKARLSPFLAVEIVPPPDGRDDWNSWAVRRHRGTHAA